MRDLPMPASPKISTVWPWPAQARRWWAMSSPLSVSRPTSPMSRAGWAASKRLSLSETPSAAQASTGSARPLTTCFPGLRRRNRSPRRRRVAAPRVGQALQPRGEVGRVADHRLLLSGALSHEIANHDEAGRDADPHGEFLTRAGLQTRHSFGDFESYVHRARRVVLVRARKAEIGENAVAEKSGDEAVITRDDARTGVLIGQNNLTHVLGVESRGERGGADQIAEHAGELTPFDDGSRRRIGGRPSVELRDRRQDFAP